MRTNSNGLHDTRERLGGAFRLLLLILAYDAAIRSEELGAQQSPSVPIRRSFVETTAILPCYTAAIQEGFQHARR